MKKQIVTLAVFLFLILTVSTEVSRWVAQIPLVYYDIFRKEKYAHLEQISEKIANRIAKCAGLPNVKIRVIDIDMASGFFSILAPMDQEAEATTIRRGIIDILLRNRVQFVVNIDRLEFLETTLGRYASSLIYKTIIAHEIAHQILEPTTYHTVLNKIYWGKKYRETMENFADEEAERLLNKCESSD